MTKEWKVATNTGDAELTRRLLDAGADINALDDHGQTALMNAAHNGHLEVVELLVKRGANLNHTAKYHLTALMLSVIARHAEVVRVLVQAGADTQRRGCEPFANTPLEYSQQKGYAEIVKILRSAG